MRSTGSDLMALMVAATAMSMMRNTHGFLMGTTTKETNGLLMKDTTAVSAAPICVRKMSTPS